jgi:hypothetical protein
MYMWECGLGQRSFGILALYPIHIHHLAVQLEYIFKNFHEYEYDALSDHIDLATGKQVCFYEINCMILFLVTQQIKVCSLTILCIILFFRKISSGSYVPNTCCLPLLSCLLHHVENDRLRLWTSNSTSIRSVIPAVIFWPTRTGPTPSGVPVEEQMNKPQKNLRCTKTSCI